MSEQETKPHPNLRVITWGARGSVPISNVRSVGFGGNTTCWQIISDRLPPGVTMVLDAGSGIVPMANNILQQWFTTGGGLAGKSVEIFLTHAHWDHTQGLPLMPHTFMEAVPKRIWAPVDGDSGAKSIVETLLKKPFFPVDSERVIHHFRFKDIKHLDTTVIVCHPEGGFHQMTHADLRKIETGNGQVHFKVSGAGKKVALNQCMVIKTLTVHHPDKTVSYRIEDRHTGEVFVLCTDHEDRSANPADFINHLKGADLLVMDAQYSRDRYTGKRGMKTAGFGHATPGYCVSTALEAGVKALCLTHHDPNSSDGDLMEIFNEAIHAYIEEVRQRKAQDDRYDPALMAESIFMAADYMDLAIASAPYDAAQHLEEIAAGLTQHADAFARYATQIKEHVYAPHLSK